MLYLLVLALAALVYMGWRSVRAYESSKTRAIGPDDDPEFLSRLGRGRQNPVSRTVQFGPRRKPSAAVTAANSTAGICLLDDTSRGMSRIRFRRTSPFSAKNCQSQFSRSGQLTPALRSADRLSPD